jgi:hypothetical protein
MLLLMLVSLGIYWYPAVSHPPLQPGTVPSLYQLGDVARVDRITLSSNDIYPGDSITLSVIWHPLQRTLEPVTVYVHLIDEVGAVIAQRDTYPGLGRAPTTSWKTGRPFEDVYRIDIPESVYSPTIARVKLGMYTSSERLNLFDISIAQKLPEGILCGEVVISGKPGSVPNQLSVNFNNQIALIGYEIEPRSVRPGDSLELTLYWEALSIQDSDLNVFAQVLDDDWQVWGSKDGGHPEWISHHVITETREITLLPDTPSGTYPIQVGLFTAAGRLPILSPQGLHLDNRYFLGPIRVE